MSRFDYVKYDDIASMQQASAKERFESVAAMIGSLGDGRAKALAFTKLEEACMWVGKAIRDEQIARNGSAELQEGRNNE